MITALIARRVDLALGAVHGPDGLAADIPAAWAAYEEATTAVDLQIWAPGLTGTWASTSQAHLASRTRIKTLTEQTRADNARLLAGDIDAVPHPA